VPSHSRYARRRHDVVRFSCFEAVDTEQAEKKGGYRGHPHRPTRRPNTISPFLLLKLHQSLSKYNSVPHESTKLPESSTYRTIHDGPDISRRSVDARRRPEEDRRPLYSLSITQSCRDHVQTIATDASERQGRPPDFGRSSAVVARAWQRRQSRRSRVEYFYTASMQHGEPVSLELNASGRPSA